MSIAVPTNVIASGKRPVHIPRIAVAPVGSSSPVLSLRAKSGRTTARLVVTVAAMTLFGKSSSDLRSE